MAATIRSLTDKTADHSSLEFFEFSFYCDRCDKSWRSEAVLFAARGSPAIENDEVRKMLWEWDHRAAFERANLEAQFHFNRCPACGRWVCDDCFQPLVNDRYDLCRDCVAKPTIHCSACGLDNPPGAKVCGCGHKSE